MKDGAKVPSMFATMAEAFDGWSPGGSVIPVPVDYVIVTIPGSIRNRFADSDDRVERLNKLPRDWIDAWKVIEFRIED